MHRPIPWWSILSALLTLAGRPEGALAGEFDPVGRFERTEPGSGFEEGELQGLFAVVQSRSPIAVEGDALDPLRVEPDVPFEGATALRMGGQAILTLQVDLARLRPDPGAADRVEVRIWQRPQGVRAQPSLRWWVQGPEARAPDRYTLATLVLVPSGRVTSDGWEEWTSGPVDFRLAGVVSPALVLELGGATDEGFAFTPERQLWVDGLEIESMGPAWVDGRACRENAACGPLGACRFGRCVDAQVVDGPRFASLEHRDQYVDRRAFEWNAFLGHRRARELQFTTQERFAALKQEPAAVDFWTRLGAVIDATEDGHAQRPVVTGASPLAPGFCAHLGVADLLPEAPRRPLVFRRSAGHPVGAQVRPGDVLTEVNGRPALEWFDANRGLVSYSADPRARPVAEVPGWIQWAAQTGAELRLQRCEPAGSCQAQIEIDYGALAAPLWQGRIPDGSRESIACDPRFERQGDLTRIAFGDHADGRTRDGITILRINGTPGPGFGNFDRWREEVDETFASNPDRLVLDHRRGDGGTFQGLYHLTRYFFSDDSAPIDVVFPWLFEQERPSLRALLASCARTGDFFGCGGAQWVTGPNAAPDVPSVGSLRDTRIAILTAIDVSGNDWLTDHLRRRRSGANDQTRVFGAVPTWGAFGEVVGLPTHGIGFVGPRIQWTGGLVAFGELDPLTEFLDGSGVPPDVEVLQTQSDALLGIDTQLEEALQWLAE